MPEITISLDDNVSAKLRAFPAAMLQAVARTLDRENEATVGVITTKRLRFPKTGPSTLEGLRWQTGHLNRSLRKAAAVVQSDQVISSIGSNVAYAGVHEYGGTFSRTSKPGSVRLRTDAQGNLLRQGASGRLAIFARRSHKRFREVRFAGGHSYTVTYPARAYIRRTLTERTPAYKTALERAVLDAWNQQPQ